MSIFTTALGFLNPLTGIATTVKGIGDMPSKEYLADRWISENLPNPASYSATLATLTNDITGWSNTCGDYIHSRNPLYNRANSRSICQSKIEKQFAMQLSAGKAQELQDAEFLKNQATTGNNMLWAAAALVVIILIIIFIIIKF